MRKVSERAGSRVRRIEASILESLRPIFTRVPAHRAAVLLGLDAPELAALARAGVRFAPADALDKPGDYPAREGHAAPELAVFLLAHGQALAADLALSALAGSRDPGAVDTELVDAFEAAAAGILDDLEAGRALDASELLALWRRGVETLRAREVGPQLVN